MSWDEDGSPSMVLGGLRLDALARNREDYAFTVSRERPAIEDGGSSR